MTGVTPIMCGAMMVITKAPAPIVTARENQPSAARADGSPRVRRYCSPAQARIVSIARVTGR